MHWINRTYSFVHIPATITYLIWLYYLTITAYRAPASEVRERTPGGPALYQARRRTMAMCNLIAFVVFTAWPCMPPRLLSDPSYNGDDALEAKSFGFVDTVHSTEGESSVWTKNRVRFSTQAYVTWLLTLRLVLQPIRRDAVASLRLFSIDWLDHSILTARI